MAYSNLMRHCLRSSSRLKKITRDLFGGITSLIELYCEISDVLTSAVLFLLVEGVLI
jgi:hypothetical protein